MDDKQTLLAPELANRLAAIDVGTNSIRLIIAEPLRDGSYRVLDDEKESARLGRDLERTGRLSQEAVESALTALRRMKQIAAGFQATDVRVIATCAVREAVDGPEFVRRVRDEVGLDIEVISSEQEGRLAFSSVSRHFSLAGKNVAIADIGGGSTEIVLASGNAIEAIFSTQLGAIRLSETYGDASGAVEEQFERMIRAIDRTLRKQTKKVKSIFAPHLLIGSGGTFTTLAEIIRAAKGQTNLPLRGYEITHAEIRHLLDRLRKMTTKARRNVPGLSADRADIIVAGVAIIDRIMRRFKLNRLQVHVGGIRDGLLLSMIDAAAAIQPVDPHDQRAAIERFAAGCGVDLAHSAQVARLAGLVFDRLAEYCGFQCEDRRLLEAAALLQDVGYLIDYDQHHKHSYHLVLNSRLPGFSPRELELVANLARYHRGSKPKPKHANFNQLPVQDQHRVRLLAAVLRLAGGLDRSHSQTVRDVRVDVDDNLVTIHVVADEMPEVDLWGARRRAEFFEQMFDVPLDVQWTPTTGVESNEPLTQRREHGDKEEPALAEPRRRPKARQG